MSLVFYEMFYLGQYLTPVVAHLFGMQAKHRPAEAWVLLTDVKHRAARLEVNGRNEHLCTASLAGSLHDGVTVCCKLFAIQVAVSIYVVQMRNEK